MIHLTYTFICKLLFWPQSSHVSPAFLSRTKLSKDWNMLLSENDPSKTCTCSILYSFVDRSVRWSNPTADRESLMKLKCKYWGLAWGWLEFSLHPERPELAQSQLLRVQFRGLARSVKLTVELSEHPDDKLPQRLGKNRRSTKTNYLNINKATQTIFIASDLLSTV